jgi:hypothetical protein
LNIHGISSDVEIRRFHERKRRYIRFLVNP